MQAQLDRLWALSPGADILGLERITRLLARLGDPQHRLPPVFHVAGTNGKGSTCAFLRAGLEAAGHRVHVYTSPHLVRFNERIRLAGRLIEDDALAPLLARVLDVGGDIGASFFEVTTAAAFLAFAETPADACVIEVGLGGRLDATNVLAPVVTGIAQLGIDHQQFLGNTAEAIAGEKAGIARAGVPLVTMAYPASVAATVAAAAERAGAPLVIEGRDWRVEDNPLRYHDARGALALSPPRLPGGHQRRNLGLAVAMLRHQSALRVPDLALTEAGARAVWPARLQRLGDGPLTARLPAGSRLWLDGGHNEGAAAAIRAGIAEASDGAPVWLVLGMLANKDASAMLRALAPVAAGLIAVPVPGHEHHPPLALVAQARGLGLMAEAAPDVATALDRVAATMTAPGPVLILGSLYLAGDALAANNELPD